MELSEGSSSQGKKGLLSRIKGAYASLAAGFTGVEKVPPEEINPQKVAQIILHDVLAEDMRLGDRSGMIFTVPTIAENLGHVPTWTKTDYKKKFPEVYSAVTREIDLLVTGGVLEKVPLKNSTVNNETLGYRVLDWEGLKSLAQNPQMGLPAKP